MPSISHRTSLGQATPHRAESGSIALPAGITRAVIRIVGAPVRWCADRLEDWRELRQLRDLDDHLLRDIGLTVAEAQRSTIFSARRDRDGRDRNALSSQRADRDAQDPKGTPSWPTTS